MNNERRTAVPNVARLSPEDIATRSFSTSFRGLSESEVRSFLRRIGSEMTAQAQREQELRDQVAELEERLRNPPPLDEAGLLEALGEETAKLLRTAREAAADIRVKAEESATRIRSEAQTDADAVRAEADEVLDRRVAEAEAEVVGIRQRALDAAAEVEASAEERAQRLVSESEAAAAATIDAATAQGRSMVDEAKRVRERMLADLGHRRSLLQAQIVELRAGREQLLEAYRAVKRSFLDATAALAAAEERAASQRPERVDPDDLMAAFDASGDDRAAELSDDIEPDALVSDVEPEPEVELASDVEPGPDAEPEPGPDVEPEPEPEPEPEQEPEVAPESTTTDGVSGLFARLRAQSTGSPDQMPHDDARPETAVDEASLETPVDAAPREHTTEVAPEVVLEPEASVDAGDPVFAARDAMVADVLVLAARRAKRAAQDDQNELLDALRRQKGRPRADDVIVAADAQATVWAQHLAESHALAYHCGAADDRAVPDDLLLVHTTTLLDGLRDRLFDAIDNGVVDEVSDRVNARFREWKTQQLDGLLEDFLVASYTAGVVATLPNGAEVRWVPPTEGCCADCADNALESVRHGMGFPSGHAAPPAHPGCRCTIVHAAD